MEESLGGNWQMLPEKTRQRRIGYTGLKDLLQRVVKGHGWLVIK